MKTLFSLAVGMLFSALLIVTGHAASKDAPAPTIKLEQGGTQVAAPKKVDPLLARKQMIENKKRAAEERKRQMGAATGNLGK